MTTYEDEILPRIDVVATARYRTHYRWVELEDLKSELIVYALGKGRPFLEDWLDTGEAGDEREEQRVMLALFGAAKQFCEQEKAQKSGYRFDDISWYSPGNLALIMPLALDPDFDAIVGESGDLGMPRAVADGKEGGNLLAMVTDIRRHVSGGYKAEEWDPDVEAGLENLQWLADKLGGEYPEAPGYFRVHRKAISNAAAVAYTHSGDNELVRARSLHRNGD